MAIWTFTSQDFFSGVRPFRGVWGALDPFFQSEEVPSQGHRPHAKPTLNGGKRLNVPLLIETAASASLPLGNGGPPGHLGVEGDVLEPHDGGHDDRYVAVVGGLEAGVELRAPWGQGMRRVVWGVFLFYLSLVMWLFPFCVHHFKV